jgi:BirA family biotin operon repressor/biotin-[acetyl-CoA-carboxylase] ligase
LSNSEPLPEGTVILAEEQFAGRGQVNNSWISEPRKNLTFSVLLCPNFLDPEKQFFLNKSISIAINDTLTKIIGQGVKIKWPNDVYFQDKKLGGVLIENILRGRVWSHSIIGIGINVNQEIFPTAIKNVTSLKKILHRDYEINEILDDLCSSIERYYLQLRANKLQAIDQQYLQCLYKLDEAQLFKINGEVTEGKITGIDQSGLLRILINNKLYFFNFKEIEFVFKD